MMSSVYQDVMSPIVYENCKCIYEHWDVETLNVTKFAMVTPLSLLISYWVSFPISGLKIFVSLLLQCDTSEIDAIYVVVLHKSYPLYCHLYFQLGHVHSEQNQNTNDQDIP